MRKRLARLFYLIAAAGLLCLTAAAIAAPYLPRLLLERYPQPRWPVPGYFAKLKGAGTVNAIDRAGKLDDQSLALFQANQGTALLIHQSGKLRVAHYGEGVEPDTKFNSYSLAKSLIGALVLKAVAEGKIDSLDVPVGRYLDTAGDQAFSRLPIRAFARMRSGIAFQPDKIKSAAGPVPKDAQRFIVNPFGPMVQLHMRGIQPLLAELRLDPDKRDKFSYQNANTAILGAVLEKIYDQPLNYILSQKIWTPSGAGHAHWRRYSKDGPVTPYCCIYATATDWLRVATFLMRNGSKDDPFLPRNLWRLYFGADVSLAERHDGYYGIHAYQNVLDKPGPNLQGPFTFMFGSRGQVVYMMPERDLIVVRFGEKVQRLHSTLRAAWRSIEHAH